LNSAIISSSSSTTPMNWVLLDIIGFSNISYYIQSLDKRKLLFSEVILEHTSKTGTGRTKNPTPAAAKAAYINYIHK
jgi:hypothetical protein